MKMFNLSKKFNNQIGAIPLLILVAVIGVIIFLAVIGLAPLRDKLFSSLFPKPSSNAAGVDCSAPSTGKSCLYLSPKSTVIAPAGTLRVQVRVNTNTETVNGVAATIGYPNNLVDVTLDETGSAFGVAAPSSAQNGTIDIARGSITPVAGDALVVTLVITPKVATGVVNLITSAVEIDSATTNTDITEASFGGNYTITANAATFSLTSAVSTVAVPNTIPVQVKVRTDTDQANLFAANISFDKNVFMVTGFDNTNSFVTQWASQTFDNNNGIINLVGGVPNPGFKTSGQDALMVTINLQAKSPAASTTIGFDGTSQIFRNSDNANILAGMNNLSVQVTGVIASPSPSVAPSPSPSVAPSISPSASPSIAPSPSPSVAPSPSPVVSPSPSPNPSIQASASPSPSPSSQPIACSITTVSWDPTFTVIPVVEGTIAPMTIDSTGNCNGQKVNLTVWEDDGILGRDAVTSQPLQATFVGNTARSSWVTQFQVDGVNGVNNPPEFLFEAVLAGGSTVITSTGGEVSVVQVNTGQFRKGDGNRDGLVNLVDLSVLLSRWNDSRTINPNSFNDLVDMNDDNVINTFDFSGIVLVLKQLNVIR